MLLNIYRKCQHNNTWTMPEMVHYHMLPKNILAYMWYENITFIEPPNVANNSPDVKPVYYPFGCLSTDGVVSASCQCAWMNISRVWLVSASCQCAWMNISRVWLRLHICVIFIMHVMMLKMLQLVQNLTVLANVLLRSLVACLIVWLFWAALRADNKNSRWDLDLLHRCILTC